MEIKVTMTAVFLAVLIIGTTLSVILTVALTSGSVGENTPKRKVVYFAMYLGDDEGKKTPSRSTRSIFQADNGSKQCSLELNKNNTISSIKGMKDSGQLYSFILYTTNAESTPPRKADDAITELESIKAKSEEKKFKQLAAVDEFLAKKKADDVLVFYIPCNVTKEKEFGITTIIEDYELSQIDKDTEEFVEKLAGIQATTMLVSNTMDSSEVVKVYKISKNNVVGKGEEVAEKIKHFAETASATTVTAVTVTGGTTKSVIETTSAAVTTTALPANMTASTSTKLVGTTTSEASTSTEPTEATTSEVPDTASTSGPITTVSTLATTATENIVSTTSPIEEATTATTSEAAETSTEIANSTSAVVSSSSTVPSTSSTTEDVIRSTTATESPTPASSSPSTTVLTSTIAETSTIMESSTLLSTVNTEAPPTNSSTSVSTTESPTSSTTTAEATTITEPGTTSVEITSQPTLPPTSTNTEATSTMESNTTSLATTSQAISSSTSMSTEATSTVESTTTLEETTSQPTSSSTISKTEAATSTTTATESSSTSLSTSTFPTTTTTTATTTTTENATSTTRIETSSTATNTETPSTTTEPIRKQGVRCLFVADLCNFGEDQSKYEQEKYFILNMSNYFFESTVSSTAGFAKYGYTDPFDGIAAALNDMKISNELFSRIVKMEPEKENPSSNTSEAIKEINILLTKNESHANSLIFISAQKNNTDNLPKFEPKAETWTRIIAVGFDGANLTNVVDLPKGAALSVPYDFNITDVKRVIDALLEAFKANI